MHYNATANTSEVVQEVRSWLNLGPSPHAFMQCQAIATFENDASGRFLTTAGLQDDGTAPASPVIRVPSDPHAQLDGTFAADTGTVDSIGLAAGSFFKTGVQTIINENASPLSDRITLLAGRMDGSFPAVRGRVTASTPTPRRCASPICRSRPSRPIP